MTSTGDKTEEPSPAKALILVADDDPELVAVLVEALSYRGYRVATARNGRQALDCVERERPQLILLDMNMPVMDGWTFARALRERYGRSIPIVVITAAKDSQLRSDEVGAEGELGKPFDLQQLYDVVEDTLLEGEPPNGAVADARAPPPPASGEATSRIS